MRKLILACVLLVAGSAALVGGCRAEAEVDPDGDVSYNGGVAR